MIAPPDLYVSVILVGTLLSWYAFVAAAATVPLAGALDRALATAPGASGEPAVLDHITAHLGYVTAFQVGIMASSLIGVIVVLSAVWH